MQAKAQPKTFDLIERMNALQRAEPRYIDTDSLGASSREWRLLRRDVQPLFKVDACSAWELTGMYLALGGDREGMERAFERSFAIGISSTNQSNHMINRLNLGLFSQAQQAFAVAGAAEGGSFSKMVVDGLATGAVNMVAGFAERAREMKIEWDDGGLSDALKAAVAILQRAGVDDAQIGRQLDIAGNILHNHRVRPEVTPLITAAPGDFEGVTYRLTVPVTPNEAFEMNVELAMAEDEAGLVKDVAFDVVFEAAHA
jgi:hypothetical protein